MFGRNLPFVASIARWILRPHALRIQNQTHGIKSLTLEDTLSLSLPYLQFLQRKALKINDLEARGIEPLSSSLSTQTSTCLAGEIFKKPTLHRHTADFRASTNFLHRPARSLRRPISLLSTFGAVAGVQLQTSRSIKPRERDLGDLRLFVWSGF